MDGYDWMISAAATANLSESEQLAFLLRIMRAVDGFDGPSADTLFWRTDGEYAPFTVFVICNDLFYWACADLEQITPENVGLLEQSIADTIDATKESKTWAPRGVSLWAPELFAARARKMRPQRPCYKQWADEPKVTALFDACGPERDPKTEG